MSANPGGPPASTPPAPKPPRRAAGPRIPLRVDPADLSRIARSFADRLRYDARSGVPGMLVSGAFHVVLMVIFAMIIIRVQREAGADALDGAWMSPEDEQAATREKVPVKLESVQLNQTQQTPRENPKPDENATEKGPPVIPVKLAGVDDLLQSRSERRRQEMLGKYGGDNNTERGIAGGLAWLSRQQQAGGNWQLHQGYPDAGYSTTRTDAGATALALLPFLGNGQTHQSGQYQQTIRKGLDWLIDNQKPNGDFHDHEELGRETAFYAHSQAVIALCETLAVTGDDALREPAERGVKFLLDAQQPTFGGWKFMPQNEDTVGDLSVTSWALMALHTARAARIDVPDQPFHRASGFLDRTSSELGARYRFSPSFPSDRYSPAMTGAGFVCRQFLGWPKDQPLMEDGLAWLAQPENLPEWSDGKRNVYGWFFIGQALHNVGGETWKNWYDHTQKVILQNQVKSGSTKGSQDVRGSWHPTNPPGDEREFARKGGRLYVTSMCLLVLELPYRQMPVYRDE